MTNAMPVPSNHAPVLAQARGRVIPIRGPLDHAIAEDSATPPPREAGGRFSPSARSGRSERPGPDRDEDQREIACDPVWLGSGGWWGEFRNGGLGRFVFIVHC